MNDDLMLRRHFESLRRAEEARVPGFEHVMARADRRSSRASWRLAIATSMVLAVVTVATIRVSRPHGSATIQATAPMLADWHSPTDFLLNTPVRELLQTIPDMAPPLSTEFGPFPPTRMTTPAHRAGRERS
jgi:hypothetical protein